MNWTRLRRTAQMKEVGYALGSPPWMKVNLRGFYSRQCWSRRTIGMSRVILACSLTLQWVVYMEAHVHTVIWSTRDSQAQVTIGIEKLREIGSRKESWHVCRVHQIKYMPLCKQRRMNILMLEV